MAGEFGDVKLEVFERLGAMLLGGPRAPTNMPLPLDTASDATDKSFKLLEEMFGVRTDRRRRASVLYLDGGQQIAICRFLSVQFHLWRDGQAARYEHYQGNRLLRKGSRPLVSAMFIDSDQEDAVVVGSLVLAWFIHSIGGVIAPNLRLAPGAWTVDYEPCFRLGELPDRNGGVLDLYWPIEGWLPNRYCAPS